MKLHTLNMIILNWALNLSNVETRKDGSIDFAVGGQAVIEGVMMRSPNSITIAVRKPNKEITVKKDHYQTLIQKYRFLNIPIVRGVVGLFEMMVIGTKAINFSANESLEDGPTEPKDAAPKSTGRKIFEGAMFVFSLIFALAFSLFLFKFVPLGITTTLEKNFTLLQDHYFVFNLVDGLIKATIFMAYIWLLSLIPSFRRVFEYHGAEHKAIFNYEKKLPLTVENSKIQTRFHPRCGTSFIIIVFVISILFYTIVPKQEVFLHNFLLRATFLPIVAGLSYEALKISAKYIDNFFVKILVAPGLGFQRLTTREPDNSQLEVGLKSLSEALAMEKAAN